MGLLATVTWVSNAEAMVVWIHGSVLVKELRVGLVYDCQKGYFLLSQILFTVTAATRGDVLPLSAWRNQEGLLFAPSLVS